MSGYAVVETALARMHDADPEAQKGAFRGRIKHLQRLGLPLGEKPGKGKRIDYTEEQIWQLAVALELSEFGLDPTIIVELVSTYWEMIFEPHLRAQLEVKSHAGPVLVISVALMSAGWRPVAESMQGLLSISWESKTGVIESLTSSKKRRIIVLDTWRMLRELGVRLAELEKG